MSKMLPSMLDGFALIPRFDEYGKPYTIILNTGEVKTPFPTTKIIDCHLRQVGSSWKGAKESAAYLLGSSSMFPFVVKVQPFINVWFPSESPRKDTCVYFALHKIGDIEDGGDFTIVHEKGNCSVIIPVPSSKFETRYNQALKYLALNYLSQFLYPISSPTGEQRKILNCAELHGEYKY